MANQEQNPPQQEQPFVAAKQASFSLEDITLNTNNEVSFYVPTGGIYGEVGVNTFRNAIGAHYLPHSREYVAPPSIDIIIQCLGGKTGGFDQITNKDAIILYSLANGINIDYASIFWEDIIIKPNKRHREKVLPYTRFLSQLMMHKMKEGYGDGEVTPYPTLVFSVNNWALKPNQPKEPLFRDHMLAICNAAEPVHSTSSKQTSVFSKEATKGGSSKAPTGSKTGHLKRKKESSSAMDSNPSQTSTSIPLVAEIHKEDHSGNDALAISTTEVDPGKSTPSDFVPQQQGMNKGAKNTSYDHLFAGIDPHVLADKTQSISEGLETVLTQSTIGKRVGSIARQVEEDEASRTIKLEDLAKLVSSIQPSFKDLDSPKDDPIIVVVDSDEDEEADEVHVTTNHKLELEKNKAKAEAALLKAQPSFPNLPRDLKEIPTKLEDFTKTITSLTSQVAELKTLQWELLVKFLSLPVQVASVQAKLKPLDALQSLLLNVTKSLNTFAQVLDSYSSKVGDQCVPSAVQANTVPAKGGEEYKSSNHLLTFLKKN
ncbi:hypothetical protein Tco_0454585 [Tanacetum coccineum]